MRARTALRIETRAQHQKPDGGRLKCMSSAETRPVTFSHRERVSGVVMRFPGTRDCLRLIISAPERKETAPSAPDSSPLSTNLRPGRGFRRNWGRSRPAGGLTLDLAVQLRRRHGRRLVPRFRVRPLVATRFDHARTQSGTEFELLIIPGCGRARKRRPSRPTGPKRRYKRRAGPTRKDDIKEGPLSGERAHPTPQLASKCRRRASRMPPSESRPRRLLLAP